MSISNRKAFSRLILIDGNAIMHRAYHALPPLTTKKGEPINAVYGFVSMLLGLINDLKPSHIAVCFDRPEETFRRKKYVKYQAQRPEMDEFLSSQITKMHDVLESFGIPVYEKAGFEADDVIGTLARRATEDIKKKKSRNIAISQYRNILPIDEVVIVTGDRDIFQLINEKVKVYVPVKGLKEGKLYGVEEVEHEFDFEPLQMIDYKALVGDSSDNYPGVPGVGPKTAIGLLSRYKTKGNIYAHLDEIPESTRKKLENGRDMADMSYELATIKTDVPIKIDVKKMDKWDMGSEKAVRLFLDYGFKTLTNRIMGNSKSPNSNLSLRKNLNREDVERIVTKIGNKIKNGQYAIRGTASMVLQGLDMMVDDIDIIADKETALLFNKVFKKEMVDEVRFSESDKFRSYFGKFVIDNAQIEIMGDWLISSSTSSGEKKWSEIYDGSDDEVNVIDVNDTKIRVTKLETELKMFAQMGRWSAFQKIKKQIDSKLQGSLF